MWPRSEERGNEKKAADLAARHGYASMWPRSEERGNALLEGLELRAAMSFNVAALRGARKSESPFLLGQLSHSRFNVAALRGARKSEKTVMEGPQFLIQLQCGRAPRSAEIADRRG